MIQTGFQISGEDMEQLGVIIYHSIKSACKVDGIVGRRCRIQGQMGAHPFFSLDRSPSLPEERETAKAYGYGKIPVG